MAKKDRGERLDIGRTYTDSFSLIWRNAVMLLLLDIIIYWAPHAGFDQLAPTASVATGGMPAIAWNLARTCVHVTLGELTGLCVIWLTLSPRTSPRATLSGMAMAVLPRLPVLVPFSIIMNFPTLLSTMARFAPGMTNALPMSLAAYGAISSLVAFALSILVLALAGPAGGVFVNETLPFIAIFKRTSQLLDGNRWRFVLTLLPMILIATVLETVLEIWLIRSGVQKSIRVASALIVSRWLNECLFVLIAVGYRDLRRIVDSGQPDQVAAVFD